jgi:anti-sigma factor RsiW
MTCQAYDTDIGDHVDGTLPADRAATLDVHLASCSRCRALSADFKTLRSAAASLDRKNPPPQIWTRVAAEINPQAQRRHGWLPWMALATTWRSGVAASILVALLVGGAWLSWREVSDKAASIQSAGNRTSAPPGAASASSHLQDTEQVMTEISNLEGIVRSDAATKAVYQASGALIDHAIDQTSAALEKEPSNVLAQQSLFEALRSKLALLQEMIALINEMRKGNQEGAARIVSGMDQ